jgi:putative alpha-1,2-mannosidase
MTFPPTDEANILFKVAGQRQPGHCVQLRLVGQDEVTGQVTSGQFCGTGTNYTLYFAAEFDRPFASAGSWHGRPRSPGAHRVSGDACGAYVTFDTTADPVVLMKVGISFVSATDAADNLRAEDPGWSLGHVESMATTKWNRVLGRIRVGGGTRSSSGPSIPRSTTRCCRSQRGQ